MRSFLIFSLLFSVNVFSRAFTLGKASSYSSLSFPIGKKGYQISNLINYSLINTEYDSSSKKYKLDNNQKLTIIENDFRFRYGIDDRFSFFLGGLSRLLIADVYDSSNSSELNLRNKGLFSINFGGVYHLFKPRNFFKQKLLLPSLYLDIYFKTFSNSSFDTVNPYRDLVLGIDSNEYKFGFLFSYFLSKELFADGKIGSTYFQNNVMAQTIDYTFYLGLKKRNFSIYAGVNGFFSTNTDPYTADPENKPKIYDQGFKLFNSVNPSLHNAKIGFKFNVFKKYRLDIGVEQGFLATNNNISSKGYFKISYFKPPESRISKYINKYKEYNLEGNVIKVFEDRNSVVLDKGLIHGLRRKKRVDFFEFDYMSGNILVASGVVTKITPNSCIVKIVRYYLDKNIKVGFVGRANI